VLGPRLACSPPWMVQTPMIDIPEVRYLLVVSALLLVLLAWWSLRSQFGAEGSLLSLLWRRWDPPSGSQKREP